MHDTHVAQYAEDAQQAPSMKDNKAPSTQNCKCRWMVYTRDLVKDGCRGSARDSMMAAWQSMQHMLPRQRHESPAGKEQI